MRNTRVPRVVVVGGCNVDIHVTPDPKSHSIPDSQGRCGYQYHTSNPGSISLSRGGVARNISECMSRLGFHPLLISACGSDAFGDDLVRHMEQECNMDSRGICRVPDCGTSTYTSLNSIDEGDCFIAISDMKILKSPLFLKRWLPQMLREISQQSVFSDSDSDSSSSSMMTMMEMPDLMIIDGNEPEIITQTLKFARKNSIRVLFEPVSCDKCAHIVDPQTHRIMPGISFISPNELELDSFLKFCQCPDNILCDSTSVMSVSFEQKCRWLLEVNPHLHCIILTLGKRGVMLAYRKDNGSHPSQSISVEQIALPFAPLSSEECVNTTGAGDCLIAAFVTAHWKFGLSYSKSAEFACHVASTALRTADAVNSEILSTEFCQSTLHLVRSQQQSKL